MDTLARLTGKDFSGPTPEIRAPTPLTLNPIQDADGVDVALNMKEGTPAKVKKRKGRVSAVPSNGEEILGATEDFVDQDG
jgi:transcription factor TFIIIB component B''